MGWPAKQVDISGHRFFTAGTTASPEWLAVVDYEEWVGLCYAWRSPMHIVIKTGSFGAPCGLAESLGEVEPVLKVAARAGFWGVHKQIRCMICLSSW